MPSLLMLEPLHARLPDFWWSEVQRIQQLIEVDPDAARFEAAFLEHAAEALAQAEDDLLAQQHAPALWVAAHQLRGLVRERQRAQALGEGSSGAPLRSSSAAGTGSLTCLAR